MSLTYFSKVLLINFSIGTPFNNDIGQPCWLILANLALRRQRQENVYESEASLPYIVSSMPALAIKVDSAKEKSCINLK